MLMLTYGLVQTKWSQNVTLGCKFQITRTVIFMMRMQGRDVKVIEKFYLSVHFGLQKDTLIIQHLLVFKWTACRKRYVQTVCIIFPLIIWCRIFIIHCVITNHPYWFHDNKYIMNISNNHIHIVLWLVISERQVKD